MVHPPAATGLLGNLMMIYPQTCKSAACLRSLEMNRLRIDRICQAGRRILPALDDSGLCPADHKALSKALVLKTKLFEERPSKPR